MKRKCVASCPDSIHDATHYLQFTGPSGVSFDSPLCDVHGAPLLATERSVEYSGRDLAREYWPYAPIGVEMTPQERADYEDEVAIIMDEEHGKAMSSLADRKLAAYVNYLKDH